MVRLVLPILVALTLGTGCRCGDLPNPASQPESVSRAAPSPTPVEAGDEAPATPSPEAEPTTPDGLVARLEAALAGVALCPRGPDGVEVADAQGCLAGLRRARSGLLEPPRGVADSQEERDHLRAALSRVLGEAVSGEDATVTLYALKDHAHHFGKDPEIRRVLEERIRHPNLAIAEAASAARFSRADPKDEASLKLAESALLSGLVERIRLAPCFYLGDPALRGRRSSYETLLSLAREEGESPLIRSCAVTGLGFVGSDADIPMIAGFLEDPMMEYAAAFSLVQGLGTPAAATAALEALEGRLKDGGFVQAGTLGALVPEAPGIKDYPVARAARWMAEVLGSTTLPVASRMASLAALKRLDERQPEACPGGTSPRGCFEFEGTLREVLASTAGTPGGPNELRVRTAIGRALGRAPAPTDTPRE